MRRFSIVPLILGIALFCSADTACTEEEGESSQDSQISKLIEQLGSDRFQDRQDAQEQLISIGIPALPQLRNARDSKDPEIATRARQAYRAIAFLDEESRQRLRTEAQEAYRTGDVANMLTNYRRLSVAPGSSLDDHLWHGRSLEMTMDGRAAVDAYFAALAMVDDRMAIETHGEAPPERAGKNVDAVAAEKALRASRHSDLFKLFLQRTALIHHVGRLQRVELDDPKSAISTLNRALAYPAVLSESCDELSKRRTEVLTEYRRNGPGRLDILTWRSMLTPVLRVMREKALAHEDLNENREALETLSRVALLRATYGIKIPDDLVWMERLTQELQPEDEIPNCPTLQVLTPETDSVSFSLGSVDSLTRSYEASLTGATNPGWVYFAVAPPSGKEFKTVTIRLRGPETPFTMYCYGLASANDERFAFLGNYAKTYSVPQGVGVVAVFFPRDDDDAEGQTLTISAEFRPRTAEGVRHDGGQWLDRKRRFERSEPDDLFGSLAK